MRKPIFESMLRHLFSQHCRSLDFYDQSGPFTEPWNYLAMEWTRTPLKYDDIDYYHFVGHFWYIINMHAHYQALYHISIAPISFAGIAVSKATQSHTHALPSRPLCIEENVTLLFCASAKSCQIKRFTWTCAIEALPSKLSE